MAFRTIRPAPAARPASDAPLSRALIVSMLGVIGALGYIVTSEAQIPPVILATAGALGCLVLLAIGLGRPEVPLYILTAYLPFSKQLAGDFGGLMTALNMTNILLLIIILSWINRSTTGGPGALGFHRMHVFVSLIAVWGVVSFIAAGAQYGHKFYGAHANALKRWFDPILLYFLFFHLVQDRQRWKNIVTIMLISVTAVSLMAIREYANIAGASSLESSRVFGIADNPNALGAFFVYYMFIFAALWLQRPLHLKRWSLLGLFVLCFRGIMVTFSRGAYLAFGVGALALAFVRNKVLFILGASLAWLLITNPMLIPHEGIRYRLIQSTFKDKNTQITDIYGTGHLEGEVDTSAAMRLVIWEGARKIIADYPVFGVGLGEFQMVIMRYAPLLKRFDAHNAYLLAGAEQGIPMVVFIALFLIMMVGLCYRAARHSRDPFIRATATGMFAGSLAFIVANVFGSRINATEVSGYFFILAALMARANLWVTEDVRAAAIQRREEKRARLERIIEEKRQARMKRPHG